jgi:hypothetical protein
LLWRLGTFRDFVPYAALGSSAMETQESQRLRECASAYSTKAFIFEGCCRLLG